MPLSGPRPLVTRYGPAEAHQQAAPSAFPTQRSVSGWPAAGSAPRPAAGWPAADGEAPPTTVLAPEAVDGGRRRSGQEWAQPEDEQPTTVFSPSGLVAWALAPDDGPPTTVLHLDLPPAEPDVRPARGSTGAHRAVSIGSLPVVPLRRLAHRNRSPSRVIPERIEPTRATQVRSVPGTGRQAEPGRRGRAGADSTGVYAGDAGALVLGTGQRVAARSPSRATRERIRPASALARVRSVPTGRQAALRSPSRAGPERIRPGPLLGMDRASASARRRRRSPLGRPRPAPDRTRRPHARPTRVRIPGPGRLRLGRRPVFSLVLGLAVVIGLALLVIPTRSSSTAPPAQAALVAPGQVNGLALGDDRLPDCAPVVASLSPRQKLAQRLMVGVNGADPAATARLVHEMQIGGIFVGGTATGLLTGQALRGVQAASRLPLAVAVDDEGGRVQRVDGLDGDLPSARTLASTVGTAEVQQIARNRGRVLAASGITMNFAPDVDVSDQRERRRDRRPVVLQRPRHRHRLRRRLRAGRARGGHLHRAQALPRARAGRRRLAPRPASPPRRSTSSRRATSPRTPGCCAPAGRWPTRR